MKKILYLLIIGVLLLPIYVKANGFGPLLTKYKAYVSNVNGTTLEVESGEIEETVKVPFETILEVYNEIEVNGVVYAIVEYNDYDSYYCKTSDLRLVNEKANLKDFYKEEKPKTLYVYKDGAYLYKGPSKIYGKVSEEQIPVGTTLTYEYSDYLFAYVTYNGKSGWVFTYPYPNGADEVYTVAIENPYVEGASVAEISEYEYIFSAPNTKIVDDNGKDLKLSLPTLTKLKVNYYINGIGGHGYNITYNGFTGWIYEGPDFEYIDQCFVPNVENVTLYTKSEIKYYKNFLFNANADDWDDSFEVKDEMGIIPKNTEVQIKYIGSAYYISHNNKEGYVIDGDFAISKTDDYFTAKTNLPVYDKIDGNETGRFLKIGKRYNCKYSFGYYGWQYIETKEFSGWVYAAETDDEDDEPSEPEIIIENPTTTTTKRNESLKKTLSRSPVIIISMVAAVVVSATALVTIILINKKKKTKNE